MEIVKNAIKENYKFVGFTGSIILYGAVGISILLCFIGDVKFSEYQTLAAGLITGFLAVGAASIAYLGVVKQIKRVDERNKEQADNNNIMIYCKFVKSISQIGIFLKKQVEEATEGVISRNRFPEKLRMNKNSQEDAEKQIAEAIELCNKILEAVVVDKEINISGDDIIEIITLEHYLRSILTFYVREDMNFKDKKEAKDILETVKKSSASVLKVVHITNDFVEKHGLPRIFTKQ